MYLHLLIAMFGFFVASGQDMGLLGTFLAKHSDAIERYIMTGYGESWKHCDLLSVGTSHSILSGDSANLHVDIKTLKTLDIATAALSSSYCLLVISNVMDKAALYSIVRFGWFPTQEDWYGNEPWK